MRRGLGEGEGEAAPCGFSASGAEGAAGIERLSKPGGYPYRDIAASRQEAGMESRQAPGAPEPGTLSERCVCGYAGDGEGLGAMG